MPMLQFTSKIITAAYYTITATIAA